MQIIIELINSFIVFLLFKRAKKNNFSVESLLPLLAALSILAGFIYEFNFKEKNSTLIIDNSQHRGNVTILSKDLSNKAISDSIAKSKFKGNVAKSIGQENGITGNQIIDSKENVGSVQLDHNIAYSVNQKGGITANQVIINENTELPINKYANKILNEINPKIIDQFILGQKIVFISATRRKIDKLLDKKNELLDKQTLYIEKQGTDLIGNSGNFTMKGIISDKDEGDLYGYKIQFLDSFKIE